MVPEEDNIKWKYGVYIKYIWYIWIWIYDQMWGKNFLYMPMYYEIILLSTISLITDIWIFETVEFVFGFYDATYITTDIKLYIEQKEWWKYENH